MAMHLKQSTASQSVLIGPFLDDTDFVSEEVSLTISNTDIRLSKNGANLAAKNSGGGTHDESGWYQITLDATDTDTVGRLQLFVHETGALPVFAEFEVLEEAVYNHIYASAAALNIDVNDVQGDVQGNVDGSVASVTGAVGSVTGAVGSVTGSVASVTGAVGSVTGNVGGNVVGSVASVTARVTADVDQVDGVALASHTAGYVPAETVADLGSYIELTVDDSGFTPTTTQFEILEASPFAIDDVIIGKRLWFSDSGDTLYGAGTFILDWDNTNKRVTVRILPQAPSDGDIIRIEV